MRGGLGMHTTLLRTPPIEGMMKSGIKPPLVKTQKQVIRWCNLVGNCSTEQMKPRNTVQPERLNSERIERSKSELSLFKVQYTTSIKECQVLAKSISELYKGRTIERYEHRTIEQMGIKM